MATNPTRSWAYGYTRTALLACHVSVLRNCFVICKRWIKRFAYQAKHSLLEDFPYVAYTKTLTIQGMAWGAKPCALTSPMQLIRCHVKGLWQPVLLFKNLPMHALFHKQSAWLVCACGLKWSHRPTTWLMHDSPTHGKLNTFIKCIAYTLNMRLTNNAFPLLVNLILSVCTFDFILP